MGELEVAAPFIRRPLLAVSGTNGKTTTTTLLGELLTASGIKTLVGGNIGTPVVSLLARQEAADLLVLEVSSFQLDTASNFHPQAAALLNITPDHLDRYPDYDAYIASKARLFLRQEAGDLKVRLAGGREEIFPLADIRRKEKHNLENIMAALLLALDAGLLAQEQSGLG